MYALSALQRNANTGATSWGVLGRPSVFVRACIS